MCMHHDKSFILIITLFLPLSFRLCYVTLFYDRIVSQELYILIQMVALGAPVASDTFLALFGTPTLLWRVLHLVGYAEPSWYFWSEVVTNGQQWYDVRVTIPARSDHP